MTGRHYLLGLVLCLVLVLGWSEIARSEVTSGSTILKSAVFVTDVKELGTPAAGEWADALSTTLTLKSPGCLIMMYSGEIATLAGVRFQALVDGEVTEGADPYFSNVENNNKYHAHAMNWWKCSLDRGDHMVQIQFQVSSGNAYVRKRTLTIFYNK